ncbi:hypothetical protein HCA58_22070 [Micromonospora sp. HNM0581]|uniref:hypothetical protein n=1 Tax=Micromonospora sp. HNM0581 TaxID=2716341 RepID=UPI00146D0985|nr:hypothetical protein [Micromonospora sp. HNM0581]NLU80985.1 hypothetical protein [Micromonospora sp. HNM0581]
MRDVVVVGGIADGRRAEVFAGIGITATQHPEGSFVAADETGRTAAHLNADLVAEDTDRAVARLTNAENLR